MLDRPLLCLTAAVAALAAMPAAAAAQRQLQTRDGFLYDVSDTNVTPGLDNGQLVNGTDSGMSSAYAGAYFLEVGPAGDGAALTRYSTGNRLGVLDRNFLTLADWSVPGTTVVAHREIYVPIADGQEYCRYVDVFENEGAEPASIRVRYSGNLGTGSARVRLTHSGNANDPASRADPRDDIANASDLWVLQDDGDARGIPSLVSVIRGPASQFDDDLARPASNDDLSFTNNTFSWEYVITVPPGERRALMTFALQAPDRESAIQEAERVSGLPDDVLVLIDDELRPNILNWEVSELPRIVFDGPVSIEEGQPITVGIDVDGVDGGGATWSVDLPTEPGEDKGDGTFDQGDDLTEVTIPGELTAGTAQYRVFVRARLAADASKERVRAHVVRVDNVAPVFRSTPPARTLFVGDTYVYDIRVDDAPAEFTSATPIGYAVFPTGNQTGEPPDGMADPVPMIDDDGEPFARLTWDVQRDQRDQSFALTLRVTDGEDAATQDFTLTVSANLPPEPPTIVAPLPLTMDDPGPVRLTERQPELVIENAVDPEADDVRYHFRVATRSDFVPESIVVETMNASMEPPPFETGLPADPSGTTRWRVPQTLDLQTYFWEVRAVDDQGAVSQARFAIFNVRMPPMPDAGPREPPMGGGGGCTISAAEPRDPAASGVASTVLLLLGALAVSTRRRR
jgi:hypothetical protein